MPTRLYITAATAGVSTAEGPVGGGVAVLEALLPHLRDAPDLEATVLRPAAGLSASVRDGVRFIDLPLRSMAGAPADRLLRLGERAYADFALEWEQALGAYFGDVDPEGAVVLANDISEGPPFAELARRGFRQAAIFHVVVADFFARRYLRQQAHLPLSSGLVAGGWRAARRLGLARRAPEIARLVWEKEEAVARHAARCVVPSQPLAAALASCYPATGVTARTCVIPWGVIGPADPARRARRETTLSAHGLDSERFTLVTLSRLSPEKRLELLIGALERIERETPATADRLALIVAGAPAYMGGGSYAAGIRRRAARLRRVQVRFPGYVGGAGKWDLLTAADLFCSPSYYEAYGLTVAQALASGTPVLAADHAGAGATVTPAPGGGATGWIVDPSPRAFAGAIRRAAAMDLSAMRAAAAAWGAAHPFADAGAALVRELRAVAGP